MQLARLPTRGARAAAALDASERDDSATGDREGGEGVTATGGGEDRRGGGG